MPDPRPTRPSIPRSTVLLMAAIAFAMCCGAPRAFAGGASLPWEVSSPGPDAASFPRPDLVGSPATLKAGSLVEIRWDALCRDVEELEILLSVDGGRSYPLRVSPELDGGEIAYRWKVPNLAAEEARLRVRMRDRGREIVGEPGPLFRIVPRLDAPPERSLVAEGPWWAGPEGPIGGAIPGLGPAPPRLGRAGDESNAEPPSDDAMFKVPQVASRFSVRTSICPAATLTLRSPVSPRDLPRRE